jgi:hypothetical protein
MDPGDNMFADVLYTNEGPCHLFTERCIAGVVEQRHLCWQADVLGTV